MPRKMCTVQVTHGVHVTGQILYIVDFLRDRLSIFPGFCDKVSGIWKPRKKLLPGR